MPRRKPRKMGSKQHSKGKKRPRGWHRRSFTPAWLIAEKIARKARRNTDKGGSQRDPD